MAKAALKRKKKKKKKKTLPQQREIKFKKDTSEKLHFEQSFVQW